MADHKSNTNDDENSIKLTFKMQRKPDIDYDWEEEFFEICFPIRAKLADAIFTRSYNEYSDKLYKFINEYKDIIKTAYKNKYKYDYIKDFTSESLVGFEIKKKKKVIIE